MRIGPHTAPLPLKVAHAQRFREGGEGAGFPDAAFAGRFPYVTLKTFKKSY